MKMSDLPTCTKSGRVDCRTARKRISESHTETDRSVRVRLRESAVTPKCTTINKVLSSKNSSKRDILTVSQCKSDTKWIENSFVNDILDRSHKPTSNILCMYSETNENFDNEIAKANNDGKSQESESASDLNLSDIWLAEMSSLEDYDNMCKVQVKETIHSTDTVSDWCSSAKIISEGINASIDHVDSSDALLETRDCHPDTTDNRDINYKYNDIKGQYFLSPSDTCGGLDCNKRKMSAHLYAVNQCEKDLQTENCKLSRSHCTVSVTVSPHCNLSPSSKSVNFKPQNCIQMAFNFSSEDDLFSDSKNNLTSEECALSTVHLLPSIMNFKAVKLEEIDCNMTNKLYCDQSVLCENTSEPHHHIPSKMSSDTSVTQDSSVIQRTSLKDKIKNRLLQNASACTSYHNPIEKLRSESILLACLEASQIRREGSRNDIGPFYGLPARVQELLATNRKITHLYEWQDKCLRLPAVNEGQNLIYTLPTSGGKTLVAEILILRQVLCKKKDALLILPYVSIVQEKVRILSEFASELGFLVEEYAGSKGRFPPTKRHIKKSLYIATIEKGQSLVNCLIESGRIESLGLVVVDELHMIGEGGCRGAAMESTLLKIMCSTSEPPQIIGMSATLNNIGDLCTFLKADVFTSDFRPIALSEYVKIEDNMYMVNHSAKVPEEKLLHHKVLTFTKSPKTHALDPDHLLDLVLEIIPDNSCLLFCPTKRNCENVALMLARLICKQYWNLALAQRDRRTALLKELREDGGGKVCPILERTIQFGIAYHHSGLTTDERRLIEDAYFDGVLCLLTCTSTLAAGVNLPAKRVILRSPYVGADFLRYSQYKQMTGRAGRAGIDSSGESILIAKKEDMTKVLHLLSGPQDVCHSSLLYQSGKGLRSLLLSLIGLKLVETTQRVFTVMEKTLLAVQAAKLGVDITKATRDALQQLLDSGLIVQKSLSQTSLLHTNTEQSNKRNSQSPELKNRSSENQEPKFKSTSFQESHDRNTILQESKIERTLCQESKDKNVGLYEFLDTSQAKMSPLIEDLMSSGISSFPALPSDNRDLQQNIITEHAGSGDWARESNVLCREKTSVELSGFVKDIEDCYNGKNSSQSSNAKDFLLEVTNLGKATFKGSIDLESGGCLYNHLKQGEQSLVLANYLHLLYLVTPYDLAQDVSPSWMIYLQQLSSLTPDEMKVPTLIGVHESYIVRKVTGQSSRQTVDTQVVKRFFLTLMLYDLWKQNSVWDVAERYQQLRGFVQNLLSSAASFASCVLRFCQELPEFWAYQELLGKFVRRLAYCVNMEFVPLMEVPGVKLGRAKQLYNAGYQSLQALASANPSDLALKIDHLSNKVARQIVSAARVMLEEKTEALLEQVEQLVPLPAELM